MATGSSVGSGGCELFGHGNGLFTAADSGWRENMGGVKQMWRGWPQAIGMRQLPLIATLPSAMGVCHLCHCQGEEMGRAGGQRGN